MTTEEILTQLSHDANDVIALDQDSYCKITFDNLIDVIIKDDPINVRLFAYCHVFNLRNVRDSNFYKSILEMHLLGQGTNGCIFSVNEDGNALFLSKQFLYDEIDYEDFIEDFQILIKTSIALKEKLKDL